MQFQQIIRGPAMELLQANHPCRLQGVHKANRSPKMTQGAQLANRDPKSLCSSNKFRKKSKRLKKVTMELKKVN